MSDEETVERQLQLLIAASEVEDLAAYLAKGRRMENLSVEQLEAEYVLAFRAWAESEAANEMRPALDDAGAEFQLRGLSPPHHLVAEESKQIGAAMAKRVAALDDDGRETMEENIEQRLEAVTKAKH